MPCYDPSKYISKDDIYLYNTGEAQKAYLTFGCHYIPEADAHLFCLSAPNAKKASVVGDFNEWDDTVNPMQALEGGIFASLIPGLKDGNNYKYCITGCDGINRYKADPFAFHAELRPGTASKVWSIEKYEWHDSEYIKTHMEEDPFSSPMSIYELDIGSFKKKEGYDFVSIREIAHEIRDYVIEMGYTHIELLPITEYPFDPSWGYQVCGYYAVTSRYGTPQDYMYFIDAMHEAGIKVIIDWVPAHFPKDDHGLNMFDGTQLFGHSHPLKSEHPEWGTLIFNYGRKEVVSFLVSSAMFFADIYHVDGIRVDAVTSMIYLDYGRKEGEYIKNKYGGNLDLDAIEFLKKLNSILLTNFKGLITIAEESTAFPMVTKPPYDGGLGFCFKWNMGFMHDTLDYMQMDHFFRHENHSKMTFSMTYAFSENYILAYSHDEVVHGKKSMIDKMFGDYPQKFASLKALYGFMFAHPGKKLMFMGSEFGQFIEWDEKKQLDWFLLNYPSHKALQNYVKALNHVYKDSPALWQIEDSWEGFEWLRVDDDDISAISFMRLPKTKDGDAIICVSNFTPIVRQDYRLKIPFDGHLEKILNSDEEPFGGSGAEVNPQMLKDEDDNVSLTLPPLSTVYLKVLNDKN
ncbi:MAG: 1,4-alpha-glucan branching protein GlgB [Eubacteriales bacterium]